MGKIILIATESTGDVEKFMNALKHVDFCRDPSAERIVLRRMDVKRMIDDSIASDLRLCLPSWKKELSVNPLDAGHCALVDEKYQKPIVQKAVFVCLSGNVTNMIISGVEKVVNQLNQARDMLDHAVEELKQFHDSSSKIPLSDADVRAKKSRREKLPLKFVNNRVNHSRQRLSKCYGRQNYNFH